MIMMKFFSNGLRLIIEKEADMKLLGTTLNKNQLFKTAKERKPDVIIFNTKVKNINVIQTTIALKRIVNHIKIIYMMQDCHQDLVLRGLEEGVNGFILNNINSRNFINSIRNVYHSHYILSGEIPKLILNHIQIIQLQDKQRMKFRLLQRGIVVTLRELDILYLLYKEYNNKEIAITLHLSEKTIRDYVSHAYKKIGINKRNKVIKFSKNVMNKSY
ncbi:hypothetical protein GT022_03930 [Agaribacter marinus]|uniref:Response regulator transcription factor n=3 Tax=Bacillaceae TaxID=186817 RepID=A0A941IBF5_9BACI|nr:response regulator transcription factor [Virgibacillus salarius]NAZ07911.1 hypothetical protein [Agaribacter marinus]QRZ18807.1 response regulator transcription factor [Virgibacillus sp. AGTR]